MNKTVQTVATLIQPGKPLMIIGPYGSGKEQVVREATKSIGLKTASVYFGLMKYDLAFGMLNLKDWVKSLYGDTVLILNDIQHIEPNHVEMVLHMMANPERRVVITGVACHQTILALKCSNVMKMIASSPEEFSESKMFYKISI